MTGGFITSKDVCEYLKISKSTLTRLTQRKEITSIQIGAKRLYRKEWVDDFIVRRTITAEGD